MSTYEQVHKDLRKERGSASQFPCISCGAEGQCWWAYQYTGQELRSPEGSPFSLDIWVDYAPMCASCHATLDWKDPLRRARGEKTLRANAQAASLLGGAARTVKLQTDPDFAEAARKHGEWLGKTRGSKGGKARAARAKVDPEYQKVVLQNASTARDAKKQRMAADPAFDARIRDATRQSAREVNSRRRWCTECGMSSNPGAIGSHQKRTGHAGTSDTSLEEPKR